MTRAEDNAAFVASLQRGLAERGLYGGTLDSWAALGGATQRALERALGWELPAPGHPELPGFRGDLARVHAWEGHNGRPYWPGGASGVTLDPGFDLGQQTASALREHYAFLGPRALDLLQQVVGLEGTAARDGLAARPALRGVRVPVVEADRLMPLIAASYWRDIVRRFPVLAAAGTPAAAQTALLSLAFNRGPHNRELEPLAGPLALHDWLVVADTIAGMQQTHKLTGIRRRRLEEAALVREAIA